MNIIIYLLSLIPICRILLYVPPLPLFLYYGIIGISGAALLGYSFSKKSNIDLSTLLFITIVILSILSNEIPEFFRPWERFISFLIILLPISPLVYSTILVESRLRILINSLRLIQILTIVSFVGFLIRFPGFSSSLGFNGLTVHPMLFGPLAGISALYSAYGYFIRNKDDRWKWFNAIFFICSVLCCLLAGSRGGLIAFLGGGLFMIWRFFRDKPALLIKIIFVISFITVSTYPIWRPYTENIEKKQKNNIEAGGTFSSREALWEDRINEFKANPFLGVGFASMDISISKKSFQKETGLIEPGSSWLFLLSSLGSCGFALFCIISFKRMFISLSRSISSFEILLQSLLMFFLLHMIIEGYILSSGSYLFFLLWLTIGVNQYPVVKYINTHKNEI